MSLPQLLPIKQNAFASTDPEKVKAVEVYLRSMPPLVQSGEVKKLRNLLVDVYERRRFILQAGEGLQSFFPILPIFVLLTES